MKKTYIMIYKRLIDKPDFDLRGERDKMEKDQLGIEVIEVTCPYKGQHVDRSDMPLQKQSPH